VTAPAAHATGAASEAGEAGFRVRQEDDVVPGRRVIVITGAALLVAVAAAFVAGLLLERDAGAVRAPERSAPASPSARAAARRIANVEQTPILVARDGLDLRDRQRDELARARWLDRDAGVATIPIERAMDLIERAEAAPR
jgi:hypothetical protein